MPQDHIDNGDPQAIVEAYLGAMQDRDPDRARGYLDDDFMMVFPGGQRMSTPEQLIDWARPRYRFVTKTIDTFDVVAGPQPVVYCFGTLAGEWPDGDPFDGIRFIDRFALRGAKITRQDVWNDIAEVRAGI